MSRIFAALTLCLALAACKGDMGPTGPAGPQGPQGSQGAQGLPGPAGPAGTTKLVYTVLINSAGQAVVNLPAAVGTDPNRPPAVACYMGSQTLGWLSVSDGDWNEDSTYYLLRFSSGAWQALLFNGIPNLTAVFVVVY